MLQRIILRDAQSQQWLTFTNPVDQLIAHQPSEVLGVLREVERQVNQYQLYAVGYIAYEAAAGFDPALRTHPPGQWPVLAFGLFAEPQRSPKLDEASAVEGDPANWHMPMPFADYQQQLAVIKQHISQGNCYQVNYTVTQQAAALDAWRLFLQIGRDAEYGAFLEFSDRAVVSASPELFFSLQGQQLCCKPMKGTAKRGVTLAADRQAGLALQRSPKDRAENLMITDMLRNDLGRVAQLGSVQVTSLFDVTKYPTLWQMTSTITAASQACVTEIIQALFPCASVTGAPKVASMEIIADLESSPRELYTGAIGYFGPNRVAQFSVGIRTALLDTAADSARYGVGGGIVWDSDPNAEYEECLLKAKVLTSPCQQPFELLETFCFSQTRGFELLEYHLQRLKESAEYFDFALDLAGIRRALDVLAVELIQAPQTPVFILRLCCARQGQFTITQQALADRPLPTPYRLKLAVQPIDVDDAFLYHKTTQRQAYDSAKHAVGGCDDVLLWNPDGYLTESCIANLVLDLEGQRFTPPVAAGLLAGTYRAWLLDTGQVQERQIHKDELANLECCTLVNSVRGEFSAQLLLD